MNWELEYKVRYERIDGSFHIYEWDNEQGARRFFDSLKNEKVRVTVWAELCKASLKDDAPDKVIVIDDFERKVVEVMGHKLLV